ncbi:histidinol dehydrogenase [Desulfogranum japonicum]|uniref:histidinol dehydrogenase n=1 Tax=Desulfogranum japonicum TaxID=231447 RepID=UPI00041635BA|nr:histidinol dehydrogenase [Desulfogranum japonicum]
MLEGIKASSEQGKQWRQKLLQRFVEADPECSKIVADIIHAVRTRGNKAVLEYTRQFDAPELQLEQMKVTEEEFDRAAAEVSDEFMETLHLAIQRITTFHEREMEDSWMLTREDGAITGRMVRPVDSAGLYVPGGQGGTTPLVSSVLMNGIPSAIAGVEHRILVTPPGRDGSINAALLVAAKEIGITEVYKTGSAWAIAALAYGTESIPRVDVIVGPGNQYVTEAKRQVMGRVRIDMIAGPSEVLIVADESGDPAFIAADMLAQAEHDSQASALLVTTSKKLGSLVAEELEKQLQKLPRKDIARQALDNHGLIMIADDLDQAIELANEIAIEHLELQVEDPWLVLPRIRHAGAVFLGNYTPEAAGDYVAGPNHVLPTMGTARISSALGVETFLKKSSIISYSRQALLDDADHIQRLAALEGLTAHGQSVAIRVAKG